jgi:hypothetical protein
MDELETDGDGSLASDGSVLPVWARIVSGILGCAAGVAGSIAVFVSTNQAGTVALLLIFVVLVLISIQGTPLQRLRNGDYAVELARTNARGKLVLRNVVDTEPPEVAEAVAESLSEVVPSLSNASHQALEGIEYERGVMNAIREMGFRFQGIEDFRLQRGGLDAVIINSRGSRVGIDTRKGSASKNHRSRYHFQMAIRRYEDSGIDFPIVIIYEQMPISEKHLTQLLSSLETDVRVTKWRSASDNEELRDLLESIE